MHEHSCVAAAICEKYIYGPDSLSLTRTTAFTSRLGVLWCGESIKLLALAEGWQRYL